MTRHGTAEHQRRSEGPGDEAAAEGAAKAPSPRRGEPQLQPLFSLMDYRLYSLFPLRQPPECDGLVWLC